MDQQINLYQPMFRRQRHLFGARTMAKTLAMLGLTLIGLYGFALFEVLGLEKEVTQLESREHAYSMQLQRVTANQTGTPNDIDGELQALNGQLRERQQLVQVLSAQQFGKTIGFSSKLRALAEHTIKGVRLTRVAAIGGGQGLFLQGESLHEELVPAYLRGLSEAPELNGLKFDQLSVFQQEEVPGRVTFQVASRAVIDQLEAGSRR